VNDLSLLILMCGSQFALVFFKHLNVRVIITENALNTVFITFLIQATWLISVAIGIKAVWAGNVMMIVAYLSSGMLGAYFSFRVKV